MTMMAIVNLGVGLAALIGGLVMLALALRRHKREHPKGVAMLIAGMMITAFGLFITAVAIAFATDEPAQVNAGVAS